MNTRFLSLQSLGLALISITTTATATETEFTYSVTAIDCTDHGPGQNNPMRARLLIGGTVVTSTPVLPGSGPEVLMHEAMGVRCAALLPTLAFAPGDELKARAEFWSYPSHINEQNWANLAGHAGDLWFETQWLVSTSR